MPTGFNSSPLYTWYSPQISSSVSQCRYHFFLLFIHSATIRELITLSGATRESTIDAISLRAIRLQEEYRFIGEWTLSVSVITFAFLLLANSKAFNVRIEYRGKLIPTITSSSPIRMSCSKISLELLRANLRVVADQIQVKAEKRCQRCTAPDTDDINFAGIQNRVNGKIKSFMVDHNPTSA